MEKFTKEDILEEISYDEQSIPYRDWGIYKHKMFHIIDKIYNQHEIELEQSFLEGIKHENISMKTKMEEEFKQRTCENCRYWERDKWDEEKGACRNLGTRLCDYMTENDFGCNKWEKK